MCLNRLDQSSKDYFLKILNLTHDHDTTVIDSEGSILSKKKFMFYPKLFLVSQFLCL